MWTDDVAEIFDLAIQGFLFKTMPYPLNLLKRKPLGLYKSRYPMADKTSVPDNASVQVFF